MRLAIACDHRGHSAKERLIPLLRKAGHEVVDFGCDGTAACDYPDYAAPLSRAVGAGDYDAGILLDGSGIGMCVVANKINGIRAALAHDEFTARRAREHNHCNVLCIGTDLLNQDQIHTIVQIFLSTPFADGRHSLRVAKIAEIEATNGNGHPNAKLQHVKS